LTYLPLKYDNILSQRFVTVKFTCKEEKEDSKVMSSDVNFTKHLGQIEFLLTHSLVLNVTISFTMKIMPNLTCTHKNNLYTTFCFTELFTDLGKLNFQMVVQLLAQANFQYCPSCIKKICLLQKGSKLAQQ
jgi:hypothetical protein